MAEPLLVITTGSRTWRERFAELWRYRDLAIVLTGRDVRVRYKQTVLGALWAIIQPLATMVVFSIFFGRLAGIPSDGYPYPVFVYSALLPWMLFANGVTAASQSVVGAAAMVQKIYFPRLMIPVAALGALVIDYVIASAVMLILLLYFDVGWHPSIALVPVLSLGVLLTTAGVGIALAAVNVSYRDFRYVVPFMVQIWMFLTPVVYGKSLVPEDWRWLLFLNPLSGLVEGIRAAYLGQPQDLPTLGVSLAAGVLIFAGAVSVFERVEARFADVI